MRNNKITFPQFLSMSLLSSLSFLFYINNIPSIYLLVSVLISLAVNLAVFILYRGQYRVFLISLCCIFLALYCVIIVSKFADYMYRALYFEPSWIIIIVLSAFAFFCTVKGIEALARASAIIAFFTILGIIYMFACAFTGMEFKVAVELPSELISPVILLLPSVYYVINYDSIISVKKRYYFIASGITVFVYLFFMMTAINVKSAYPIQFLPEHSAIGVFKGADCILLAILTISAMYSIAVSVTGIFKAFKHKYITNSVFIALISVLSIITINTGITDFLSGCIFVPAALIIVTIILIISAFFGYKSVSGRKSMYKNA